MWLGIVAAPLQSDLLCGGVLACPASNNACQVSVAANTASTAQYTCAKVCLLACLQASNEEADPTGSLAKKDSKDLKPKRKSVKKVPAAKAATVASYAAESQSLPNTGEFSCLMLTQSMIG